MPAFNFQKQFAGRIRSGLKSQTIRAARKDGRDPKPGDTLYLYTGMRTKECRKIKTVTCRQRDRILIPVNGCCVEIDGMRLTDRQHGSLAINDGFTCWDQMRNWFEQVHGLPFSGYIYHW